MNVCGLEVHSITTGPLMTNCYLIHSKDNELIIIDAPVNNGVISEYITKRDLQPVVLINTHGHIDHIFGNAYFKERYNLSIGIHEDDIPLIHLDWNATSPSYPDDYQSVDADIILSDGDDVELSGSHLKVIHTPGHSPGSICLLLGNVLFSGDTIFREGIGRTDITGGSSETLINSIKTKIFNLAGDTLVMPGHGEETTIGYEMENNPFLSSDKFI